MDLLRYKGRDLNSWIKFVDITFKMAVQRLVYLVTYSHAHLQSFLIAQSSRKPSWNGLLTQRHDFETEASKIIDALSKLTPLVKKKLVLTVTKIYLDFALYAQCHGKRVIDLIFT